MVRVLGVGGEARQHLSAHPVDGVGIEARLDQREAQQIHRLVAVLGEEPGRDRNRIRRGPEGEVRGEAIAGPGKALRIKIARAFLEQAGHQVDRPPRALGIERGAAAKSDLERREGQFVRLDQPGVNAAGRGHVLDLDIRPDGQGEQDQRGSQAQHHWLFSSSSCISQPVTARRRSNTSRAAAITSSGVTA